MRFLFLFFIITTVNALDNQRIFPLDNYSQNITYWLDGSSSTYNQPILAKEYQTKMFVGLKHRYFGTLDNDPSPWSKAYVGIILKGNHQTNIFDAESKFLVSFDNSQINNQNKTGYAINLRPYPKFWIEKISQNLNLMQFKQTNYSGNNRAIATDNLYVRILPTDDPFYYSNKIAGEGYPFDNLQNSVIYAGTPLYVIGNSLDRKWMFVLSPDIIGWVHNNSVAKVNDNFIKTWQTTAYKNLVGINQNNISILDGSNNYLFSAYIGTLLPAIQVANTNSFKLLVPIRNANGVATINTTNIDNDKISRLPLSATPANFRKILSSMQGRSYGWGNLDMYNDCSSELKNIYALFGIYIPRNTKSIDNAGTTTDLSSKPIETRLAYLVNYGKPLLTLIHINNHVMLYIGRYSFKNTSFEASSESSASYPLVYQQVWGLKDEKHTYRAIIGQSVFFPLLTNYPENNNLISQANFPMFKLIRLDESPGEYTPDLNELLY